MFVFHRATPTSGHVVTSSILAGTCGIAAGVAQDIAHRGGEEHVWCFLGDGAEEEGHFYEAVLYASSRQLPLTFIIEDNDRQVDTPLIERRPNLIEADIGWPWCVERYRYRAKYPHAGSGCRHQITFNPEAIARLKP